MHPKCHAKQQLFRANKDCSREFDGTWIKLRKKSEGKIKVMENNSDHEQECDKFKHLLLRRESIVKSYIAYTS